MTNHHDDNGGSGAVVDTDNTSNKKEVKPYKHVFPVALRPVEDFINVSYYINQLLPDHPDPSDLLVFSLLFVCIAYFQVASSKCDDQI